jgi:hypothetical protein
MLKLQCPCLLMANNCFCKNYRCDCLNCFKLHNICASIVTKLQLKYFKKSKNLNNFTNPFYVTYLRSKKRSNFLNSSPTSIEGALRLLSAPSGRCWQQTAICLVSQWALVVELHPLNWARAQAVRRINPTNHLCTWPLPNRVRLELQFHKT